MLDADLVLEFVQSFGQASDKCYDVGLWPESIWSKSGVLLRQKEHRTREKVSANSLQR